MNDQGRRIRPLANDFVTLYESPDPRNVFAYSPGIIRLEDAKLVATAGPRLMATLDLGGPGVMELEGVKYQRDEKRFWQGRVYTSDDGGETWTRRVDFPFMHARPFVAGDSVYVLGQAGDLMIIRSDDDGETWSDPVGLTDGQKWHQAPSNVHHANGCVYLVMERRHDDQRCRGWSVSENAPVLMRAKTTDDLTRRESWTFASEMFFCDEVSDRELDGFGVPFYPAWYPDSFKLVPGRSCAPIGWLETNVVRFTDPDHVWSDPSGRTLHLWMRAHTGLTNLACILQVKEMGDKPGTGPMETSFVTAPSGKKVLYVPCPGGQNKFHVLHDEQTRLYWLLSVQATDSLTRADRLPEERYNIPSNERRRLALHFSRNMWDWCFAGLVAVGPCERGSRHYASMAIDGDDLVVLSRSGDERAKNPHDGNLITFHRVEDFRDLIY